MRNRYGLVGLVMWLAVGAGSANAVPVAAPLVVPSMCGTIAAAATKYRLPIAFFTRLLWQESRFDVNALSPAGAQGVAQFMPATAADRGLADPFEPLDAIDQSAGYLSELRQTFGNLGLAAAGYNAGPGRVSRWLAGQADLPLETIDYVWIVTGHSVEEWRGASLPNIDTPAIFSCPRFVERRGQPAQSSGAPPVHGKDWAVILIGNPRREQVLAEYRIVRAQYSKVLGGLQPSVVHKRIGGLEVARYIVQIEQDSRSGANDICGRLQRAGGSCFVLSNR